MENDVAVKTIGCNNFNIDGVKQRRNKLKGTAQQKILSMVMQATDDVSINVLYKIFTENISKLYVVESPLIINNILYERKSDYLVYDDLDDIIEIKIRTMIQDRTYKECSFCGQKISAFKQWSRRCYRCQQGNFRFPSVHLSFDKILYPYDEKEKSIEKLSNQGYIKQCTFLNKRLDFFRFNDGIFDIFESKNKENTMLTYSDYYKSLRYPIMVEQCGYTVKSLNIIYNGQLSPKIIERFPKNDEKTSIGGHYIGGRPTKREVLDTPINLYGFGVNFIPIDRYLKNHGCYVEKVIVSKKKNKYFYNVIEGDSDQIIIDLSGIDESWNLGDV